MTTTSVSSPVKSARIAPVSPGTTFDPFVRLNVDQYHELMRVGILEEGAPIELLNGVMCWKDRRDRESQGMVIGNRHRMAVIKFYDWLFDASRGHGCRPMSQQPVRLTPRDCPEPDGCLIKGTLDDYHDHHPEPREVVMVAEVSDSSLNRDLGYKLGLYATVGIKTYWVINLDEDVVEVHERPDMAIGEFRQRTIFHKGESVSLILTDGTIVSTPVESLIP